LDVDPDVVALGPHDGTEEDGAQARDAHARVDVQVGGLGLDENQLLQRPLHRLGLLGAGAAPRSCAAVGVRPNSPTRYRAAPGKSTIRGRGATSRRSGCLAPAFPHSMVGANDTLALMDPRRAYLLVVLVIVFWAGNYPLGKPGTKGSGAAGCRTLVD